MSGEQILVVDDDKDLVNVVKAMLENAGYRVVTASNTKEARQTITMVTPDLAIIDVIMDSLTAGIELAQEFRADKRLSTMPLIMMTGINQEMSFNIGPESEEGYLPVDVFMEKPVDPGELLNNVRNLLKK